MLTFNLSHAPHETRVKLFQELMRGNWPFLAINEKGVPQEGWDSEDLENAWMMMHPEIVLRFNGPTGDYAEFFSQFPAILISKECYEALKEAGWVGDAPPQTE